jgi:basic amino acid/polyamine antiporter, APA family
MGIVFLLTVLLVIGIKESARFTSLMVVVKVGTVATFVLVGFSHVTPAGQSRALPGSAAVL